MPGNQNEGCTNLLDLLKSSPQIQSYFLSLPAYVQETMYQSGAAIQTEDDLRSCAENLLRQK